MYLWLIRKVTIVLTDFVLNLSHNNPAWMHFWTTLYIKLKNFIQSIAKLTPGDVTNLLRNCGNCWGNDCCCLSALELSPAIDASPCEPSPASPGCSPRLPLRLNKSKKFLISDGKSVYLCEKSAATAATVMPGCSCWCCCCCCCWDCGCRWPDEEVALLCAVCLWLAVGFICNLRLQ